MKRYIVKSKITARARLISPCVNAGALRRFLVRGTPESPGLKRLDLRSSWNPIPSSIRAFGGVGFFGDCNSTLDGAPSLALYAFEQVAHSPRYRGFRVRPFAPPCSVNVFTLEFRKHRVKIGDFHSPSGG